MCKCNRVVYSSGHKKNWGIPLSVLLYTCVVHACLAVDNIARKKTGALVVCVAVYMCNKVVYMY